MIENKSLQKLGPTICEAVARNVTDDKRWTSLKKVREYILNYFDFSEKYINRHFLRCIKTMEAQQIITRKVNSISFVHYGIQNDIKEHKKTIKKKKEAPPLPKNLGPDVVITRSGRVSIVHKEIDEFF